MAKLGDGADVFGQRGIFGFECFLKFDYSFWLITSDQSTLAEKKVGFAELGFIQFSVVGFRGIQERLRFNPAQE